MRRYTEPEMVYKRFAAECVVTASGGGASSMSLLKEQLGNSAGDVASAPIIERNWTEMGE